MNEREQAEQALRLRTAVENFVESAIGRYLVNRAQTERANALEELGVVAPNASDQIVLIQQRVRVLQITFCVVESSASLQVQRRSLICCSSFATSRLSQVMRTFAV